MNPKYKQKWIEALRSGQYRQAWGRLRSFDGRYCCLGVLREIIAPGSGDEAAKDADLLSEGHSGEAGLLYKDQRQLADMNDSGKTFPQIADYIERNL